MNILKVRKSLVLAFLMAVVMTSCGDPDKTAANSGTPLALPTVISVTPLNNAVLVCPNVPIVSATFSKAMNPSTFTSSTFTLMGPGSTSVAGSYAYTSATNTETFTPTVGLAASTAYTATITTGALDTFGNALAANFVWTFTTSPICPPVIGKAFNPTTIALNATTSLTFTITNPATNNVALTGVAFSDTLPVGLMVANSSVSTCGGTLTTTLPTGIVLAGATVAAHGQCVFSVTVTGAASGNYTNTTGNVSSTNGGNGNTASANLIVATGPVIAKAFNPTTVPLNATTTLTFTITNPAINLFALTGVGFSDTLPTGLTVVSGSAGTCGGTLTTTSPKGIVLAGATIAANGQCVFSVTVTGAASGNYTNTTGNVNSTNGGPGNTASANLTVASPPVIAKAFVPNTIPIGTTSVLTFTLINPVANLFALTGVGFSDTLPVGLTVASSSANPCGGTLTTTSPTGIVLTGATIPVNSQCTFNVTVTGAVLGNYTNTTGNVTSTNGGTGLTASANLAVTAMAACLLGTAGNFGILGATPVVSNTGPTVVTGGDVGINPACSITGFGLIGLGPPGVVTPPNGISHQCDAVGITAQNDLTTAYNNFAAIGSIGAVLPGDLVGLTLAPGAYTTTVGSPSLLNSGTLTLAGTGSPTDTWVFYVISALTTASSSQVIMTGGGNPGNVYWVIGSAATLGTNSTFAGNIMANATITLNTGATLNGRALDRSAAVTMDSNLVFVPSCP